METKELTSDERIYRLEVWKETTDEALNGKKGTMDKGLIRDYWDRRAEEIGSRKFWKTLGTVAVIIQSVVGIIVAIDKLHIHIFN